MLILFHSTIVFGKRRRELMGTIAFGNKIERVALGRVQRCMDRIFTGVGDRCRRQACDAISVISGFLLQVGAGDIAFVAFTHTVNYCRIGL